MIDRIKQTVQTYLNTDGIGNFKPKDFNAVLHLSVQQRFETLFFEVNRMSNRQNRGLINGGLENVTDKVREKIQHYLMLDVSLTYIGNTFSLPSDLRYFDEVQYNGDLIDMCKNGRTFRILKSGNPTEQFPIGLKAGSVIKVDPISIIDNVTCTYLRNPIRAKWTYNTINNEEVYNPDADDFVDVDAHASEEFDLTISVLKGFGINLKEKDIQAIAQSIDTMNYNQENAS